eukprot:TRINITY_DN56957_c0_g1_i1.p1 TRINITY_DN56957_c0_g1~~TRINITY_DN56957_c0_g1_i1.p1  ORF type:complete len:507 (+),score=137.52 TRINITY_DN56957_c0_g1_i1:212-1732(+)
MADVSVVKALRATCNELEEKLDAAEETRDSAVATNEELEAELAVLRDQLASSREAGSSERNELLARCEQLTSSRDEEAQRAENCSRRLIGEVDDLTKQRDFAQECVEVLQKKIASDEEATAAFAVHAEEAAERTAQSENDVESRLKAESQKTDLVSPPTQDVAALEAQRDELTRELHVERQKIEEFTQRTKMFESEIATLRCKNDEPVAPSAAADVALLEARVAELDAALDAERKQATELKDEQVAALLVELEEERQRCASVTADMKRLKRFNEELSEGREDARHHTDAIARNLEEAERALTKEAQRCEDLQAQHDKCKYDLVQAEKELEASSEAHNRTKLDLDRVFEAHGNEKQRAKELEANIGTVESLHGDLFAKYSNLAMEFDGLKDEQKRVSIHRDELRVSLEEELRLKKEREEAEPPGPTQLSVSDVIISVTFDGLTTPLEVRPWDTNLEDVVSKWLGVVQKSTKLKPSVVRYLKHLEETTDSFPVRLEARLSEVHEEFAI